MDKHGFTFSNLHPDQGQNIQPYTRLLIFFKKRPDISEEHFRKWWGSVHADLAISAAGFGIHCSRYVQFVQSPESKAKLKSFSMPVLDFDGIGEIHIKSLDDWVAFSSTFDERLTQDGANFMQEGSIQMMVGTDNLVFGAGIEESGGKDGILPSDGRMRDSKL